MNWPVTVSAETNDRRGRKIVMRRTLEGLGDVEGAMLRALQSRNDHGWPFIGCEIVATTPLGQRVKRILEEEWGELRLLGAV